MKSLIFLIFLSSCLEQTGYNGNQYLPQNEDTTTGIGFTSFSTRLSNNLLISGTRCSGGETADAEGRTYTCNEGQFLVVVDNINSCTPEGCTNVVVQPQIMDLIIGTNEATTTFYILAPTYELSDAVENTLDTVYLRAINGQMPVVVFR